MADPIIAFRQEVIALKPKLNLPETEDTWDVIAQSIASLNQLCQAADGNTTTDVVLALKNFHRPLTNAMSSDRTRLSGPAIELISTVATGIGANFEPLLPLYLPILLTLCSRTNKVMVARARMCIFSIIEGTHLPSILPYFTHFIKEKSTSSRLVIAEGAWMCLNCFNPPDLEKDTRAQDIEAIIWATARDRSSDVRKVGKKIFESYKVLLPARVEKFTTPLTPTIRKYLDVQVGIQKAQLPSNIQSKVASGSNHTPSTSVITIDTSVAVRHSRNQSHLRSQSRSTTAVALPIPIRNIQPSRCAPASRPISYNNHVLRNTAMRSNEKEKEELRPVESHKPQRHIVAASSNPATSTIGRSGPKRIPLPALSHDLPLEIQCLNRPPSTTMNSSTTSNILLAPKQIPCKSITSNLASESNRRLNSQSLKISSQTAKVTGRPKISTLMQPTLSQLARSKKPVNNKTTSLAGPKPLWGRQTAHREVPKGNSTGGNKTGVQTSNKSCPPAPAFSIQKDRSISPSQIALPRSPSPQSITETATAPISPEVTLCENATIAPMNPELLSTVVETPSSRFALSANKTPISALLSSIQHGFVFTPTSPLSPPHHYLRKDFDATATSNDQFILNSTPETWLTGM